MKTLEEMKEEIKVYTKKQKESFQETDDSWNTITLYHGTTTKYLNDILKNGLTPRKENKVNNFSDVPSNEELVYLTTRWHYWYAYNANQESLIKQVGEKRFEEEDIETLWNETGDFPMYVTCEVPVEFLTLDEDVVYQRKIRKGFRDGTITSPADITVDMCLEQGTIASLQTISPEYINEIVILGNAEYKNYLLEGQYGADASNWFSGLGIGHSDLWELIMLEHSHFKKGNQALEVEYPPENNKPIKKIQLEDSGLSIIR
ncbi:hypothetical protein CVD28_01545 [Bacillus sp. M6-12]|uniref:hypothetical protein n=1 Tax=Bacillus sp. M6-12 TaxID=2054166 RepID=UPI000C77C04E|nr:hypothetical protein [Bacillus sp. M6-12]PLS19751.1 hypothetical protein CVD28_01545 [Bacillus sp. M6-12]